jgi:hypothetical protein
MSLLTSWDAIDKVYQHLQGSAFTEALKGSIYKIKRPVNATSEDAVINSLGMPGDQLQKGLINLNIHVPNQVLLINGKQDTTQPDYVRAQTLTTLAIQSVEEYYNDEYWFVFQQQNIVESTDIEIVVNIRINFFSINL